MNKIISTNPNNWPALIARVAIAITIFPHGAQKLLGWFGGAGFTGSMGFLTGTAGLPWIVGFLFIIVEFFGPLFLFFGLSTRIAASAIIIGFIGVMFQDAIRNGFFMHWGRVGGEGEGLEYFVLLFGLAFISLYAGGGKASVDALIIKNKTAPKPAN